MREPGAVEADRADQPLLAAAARGSRTAFATLVERYYPQAYRVAWRMTAGHADCEDVVQDVFLKLWDGRERLTGVQSFPAYVMRAIGNRVIDRVRRQPMTALEDVAEPPAPADRTRARREVANSVDRVIAGLPERQRQALVLAYFEGFGNIETAEAMDISVEAVESLLGRAKRSLKRALHPDREDLMENLEDLND